MNKSIRENPKDKLDVRDVRRRRAVTSRFKGHMAVGKWEMSVIFSQKSWMSFIMRPIPVDI